MQIGWRTETKGTLQKIRKKTLSLTFSRFLHTESFEGLGDHKDVINPNAE